MSAFATRANGDSVARVLLYFALRQVLTGHTRLHILILLISKTSKHNQPTQYVRSKAEPCCCVHTN